MLQGFDVAVQVIGELLIEVSVFRYRRIRLGEDSVFKPSQTIISVRISSKSVTAC